MSLFWKKPLGFQAKVLIPVVTLLMFFLAVIVWIVNQRITHQFEEETRQTLLTSDAVFQNSFDIRTRNLLLRYQNVANEPRFKAVAQLAEPKTMKVQLDELLREMGAGAEVMIFTFDQTRFLAGSRRDPKLDLHDFQMRSTIPIQKAIEGHAAADTMAAEGRLFDVVSVPVIVNDALAGVLTIGVAIGPEAAQEFKSLTHSEIAFISAGNIAVSSLQERKLYPDLQALYQRLNSSKTIESFAPEGEHYLCLAGNFAGSSTAAGYLLLSSYEKSLRENVAIGRMLLLLSFAGILLSSLLIWVLIRKITRPLRQLRDSAEAVGRGDFSRRVEVDSKDEYGELAAVFNQMMENLTASHTEIQETMKTLKDTQEQLIQTEKLSAMGEFVAGVAHELNNPLTGVIGFSQMLHESGIDERQQTYLDRVIGSAERCRKIVQSLLTFSRRHRPERKSVHIHELLESALEILKYELLTSNIEVVTDFCAEIPPIPADPHQIQQVFLNILNNAKQAIEQSGTKGTIHISILLVNNCIRIRFQDTGPGISPQDLKNIFNPFFTTKRVGEGTGLGLSLSYGIIREHGGSITAESQSGSGAIFTVDLPVRGIEGPPEQASLESTDDIAFIKSGSGKKVLVIDDEESILELIQEILLERRYRVDTAVDENSALELLGKTEYDLVICDWKIPGSSGQSIYEHIRDTMPQSFRNFLFITGDVLGQKAEQFLEAEGKMYLLKPFSISEFRHTIEKILL
jgi:two-component system NtrC family sensor kinase